MTCPVTLKPKCYIFVCAGCDLLASSERSDALTCSPACRVRAHRNGRLKSIRSIASPFDIVPGLVLQSMALERLCPQLGELVKAGKIKIGDTRRDVWAAFVNVLAQ